MRVSPYIGRVIRTLTVPILLVAALHSAHAQGPIFLPPPNTTPVVNFAPSLSYSRKSSSTDLGFQMTYGVRPNFSFGFGATTVMAGNGPIRLGRLQAQVKFRLLQRVSDGRRTVVGLGWGVAVPVSHSVGDVARDNSMGKVVGSLTAARVGRRWGYFGGGQYTLDAHHGGDRSTGTLGVALSWRIKPAAPGLTGGPGFTLFGETLGHWETNHSAWLAVAPGAMYRVGRTQFKAGVRIPVRRWNSNSRPVISVGTSLFIPV